LSDASTPGDELPEITATDLNERMQQGQPLKLVDVRELHERQIADLPDWGQESIPVREFVDRIDEIDPGEPTVLYCRSGARSGWATRQLLEQGYGKVWNLRGGLLAWKDEVDPTMQEY